MLLSTRPPEQEVLIEPFTCCSRSEYGEKRNLEDKVVFSRSPDIVSAVPPITRWEQDLSHGPSRMETLERTWCSGEKIKLAYTGNTEWCCCRSTSRKRASLGVRTISDSTFMQK